MAAPWNETTLPTILSRCAFKDIFNVDKFGLFYQILPCKTKHFKSQECSCGKHSKVCLNGLAAGNAFGERMLQRSKTFPLSMPASVKNLGVIRTA